MYQEMKAPEEEEVQEAREKIGFCVEVQYREDSKVDLIFRNGEIFKGASHIELMEMINQLSLASMVLDAKKNG